MNRFVVYYLEARRVDTNPLNRQLIFTATAQTIASTGTIDDLKALTEYYQNESEETKNENNKIA